MFYLGNHAVVSQVIYTSFYYELKQATTTVGSSATPFFSTKAKIKNLKKVNKHNCPYLSRILVVKSTIISVCQWFFTLFALFIYCIAIHHTLEQFGKL